MTTQINLVRTSLSIALILTIVAAATSASADDKKTTSKPTVSEIVVTKSVDKSSTSLF